MREYKRISVLGDVDRNHLAAMFGRPDLDRRQFDRNPRYRRGDLFDAMREKFHYQTETGEGASQFDRNGVTTWMMDFLFGCRRPGGPCPISANSSKLGGILFDLPDEVVPAAAQDVEWFDPVLLKSRSIVCRTGSWSAKTRSGSTKASAGLSKLTYSMSKSAISVAVPKGTANFETAIQKGIQRSRRIPREWWRCIFIASAEKLAR